MLRIVYPRSVGAWLELNMGDRARARFDLLEVSARSVRYDPGSEPMPRVGTPVGGLLRLAHGAESLLRATVERVQVGEVTLRIDRGGPSSDALAAEQLEVSRRA